MKGIIKKDLYMIINYCKPYLLFLITFLVFPLIYKGASFLSAYLFLLPSMCVITIISFDEKNNWEAYFNQLPIKVEDTILAKYIIGGGISICLLFLYSLGMCLRYGISFIYTFATLSIVSFVSFGITIPFYFRFGSHIGRIAYYLSLGIIVFFAMQAQFNISGSTSILPNNVSGMYVLLGIGVFVGSYFLSVIAYKIRLKKMK